MTGTRVTGGPAPTPRKAARLRCVLGTAVALTLGAGGLAACSSSTSASPTTAATTSGTCQPPSNWRSTTATAVAGTPSDFDLTSFDGTKIRIHWFPDPSADGQARPTVLMGPGWGQSGETDTSPDRRPGGYQHRPAVAGRIQRTDLGPAWIREVVRSGRGRQPELRGPGRHRHHQLGGPTARRRDHRPGVPRVGMVGESYGGGIQFAAAEQDCRIDAIAPTIAWNSLGTSLDKSQTPKEGWSTMLLASVGLVGQAEPGDRHAADKEMNSTGTIDSKAVAFFLARGPAAVPVEGQGPDPDPARHGRRSLHARRRDRQLRGAQEAGNDGVDGLVLRRPRCLPDRPGYRHRRRQLSLAWMQHYVAQDGSVSVLKGFEFVDQDGTSYAAPDVPVARAVPRGGRPVRGHWPSRREEGRDLRPSRPTPRRPTPSMRWPTR